MTVLEFVKFVIQVNLTLMFQVLVLIAGIFISGVIYSPAMFCIYKGLNLMGNLVNKIINKVRKIRGKCHEERR